MLGFCLDALGRLIEDIGCLVHESNVDVPQGRIPPVRRSRTPASRHRVHFQSLPLINPTAAGIDRSDPGWRTGSEQLVTLCSIRINGDGLSARDAIDKSIDSYKRTRELLEASGLDKSAPARKMECMLRKGLKLCPFRIISFVDPLKAAVAACG